MDGKLIGKILWFNPQKGYGELIGDSGERFFFLKSDCLKYESKNFATGKHVKFSHASEFLFGKQKAIKLTTISQQAARGKVSTRRSEASV